MKNGVLKPVVIVLGPSLEIISGVSTHVRSLLSSGLIAQYGLLYFQVGSHPCESFIGKVWRALTSPLILAATIIVRRADIVHINSSLNKKAFWRDLVYLCVAKVLRAKAVYQVHGGSSADFCFNNRKRSYAVTAVGRIADSIVLLSERERRNFQRLAVHAKLVVIPNAVDLDEYRRLGEKSMEGEHYHLGYLGRLVVDKGVLHLVEAMSLLRNKIRTFTLHIAGSGPCVNELRQLVARLELREHVNMCGELHGKNKLRFWQQLHIFVFPSYYEGLPYALLESLASGTPIVTTPVGAIPEVIEDDIHGVLVPVRDTAAIARAIERLLAQPNQLKQMAIACRKRALEFYGIDRLTSQFADLYSNLAAAARSDSRASTNQG